MSRRFLQPGQQAGEIALPDMLARIGNEVVGSIRNRLAGLGLGRSRLLGSTKSVVFDTRVEVRMNSYYVYVESGRRPGAKMPPEKEILAWMRREGIAKGREAKAVYAIRRAIARDGIPARPFLLNAINDAGANKIPQIFRLEMQEVAKEYTQTLKETIDKP